MKRPDYQNPNDDLEEITDRRNAEIRAWGKQVLSDADALLLSGQVRDGGDWDLIQDEDEVVIAPAPEIEEPVEEEPVEEPQIVAADVPKARAKPKAPTS